MPARADSFPLYDLGNDPGETTGLASQQPQRLANMEAIGNPLDQAMIPTKPLD